MQLFEGVNIFFLLYKSEKLESFHVTLTHLLSKSWSSHWQNNNLGSVIYLSRILLVFLVTIFIDNWDFLTKFRYRVRSSKSQSQYYWVSGPRTRFQFQSTSCSFFWVCCPPFSMVIQKKFWMLGLCTVKMPINNSLKFESLWFCQF